jgi:hypothetical protein
MINSLSNNEKRFKDKIHFELDCPTKIVSARGISKYVEYFDENWFRNMY